MASSGQTGRIFVGRQREMGELRAALDMLVGEPGIGKTRTAQELVSHAQGRGRRCIAPRPTVSAAATLPPSR